MDRVFAGRSVPAQPGLSRAPVASRRLESDSAAYRRIPGGVPAGGASDLRGGRMVRKPQGSLGILQPVDARNARIPGRRGKRVVWRLPGLSRNRVRLEHVRTFSGTV